MGQWCDGVYEIYNWKTDEILVEMSFISSIIVLVVNSENRVEDEL